MKNLNAKHRVIIYACPDLYNVYHYIEIRKNIWLKRCLKHFRSYFLL